MSAPIVMSMTTVQQGSQTAQLVELERTAARRATVVSWSAMALTFILLPALMLAGVLPTP